MRQNKSVSFLQQKRQWHHVIAPIVKFNRNTSDFGCPLDFFIHLEKLITSGYQLKLNIPKTLCGVHDNCLSTVFENDSDAIGSIKFKANLSKMKFDIEIDKINKKQILQMKQSKY